MTGRPIPTLSLRMYLHQGDVFVTTKLRALAGAAALAAGLWILTGPTAAPAMPKDTYKKVVEADIAQLQKHLDHIVDNLAANPKEANRYGPTTRGLAMMLTMSAEATGEMEREPRRSSWPRCSARSNGKTPLEWPRNSPPRPAPGRSSRLSSTRCTSSGSTR